MIKRFVYIYFMFDQKTLHGYVGKSLYPEKRIEDHWKCRLSKYTYVQRWLCTLSSVPEYEILEKCTQKNWHGREVYWIARRKREGWTLTNLTSGGEGLTGCTEETRIKLRDANLGKKLSVETKEKLRIISRNRKDWNRETSKSEETRRKISLANKGRKLSKEARRKISASLMGNTHSLGNNPSEETRMRMSVSQKAAHVRRRKLK